MTRIAWIKKHRPECVTLYEESLAAYEAQRSFDGNFSDPVVVAKQDDLHHASCKAFDRFIAEFSKPSRTLPGKQDCALGDCDACPGKRFFWEGPEDNCDGGMRGVCLDCGHWCVH
jgi:hypothetical protein